MSVVALTKYQFGFHATRGVDEDGISHDVPEYAEVIMGPNGDEDGLPDSEFVAYKWYSYSPAFRQKVASLVVVLDVLLEYGDSAYLNPYADVPIKILRAEAVRKVPGD